MPVDAYSEGVDRSWSILARLNAIPESERENHHELCRMGVLNCYRCAGEMRRRLAKVPGEYAGKRLVVETDAMVCSECGYTTLHASQIDAFTTKLAAVAAQTGTEWNGEHNSNPGNVDLRPGGHSPDDASLPVASHDASEAADSMALSAPDPRADRDC